MLNPLTGVTPEEATPLSPTRPVPDPSCGAWACACACVGADPNPDEAPVGIGVGAVAVAAANVFLTLESKEGSMPCSGSSSKSSCGNVVNVTVGRTFELAIEVLRGVGPDPGAWDVLILPIALVTCS